MPRPRTPLAIAEAAGRTAHDPARFKHRPEPRNAPIGEPPKHMSPAEKNAWRQFCEEMKWLRASDSALLAIACRLRVATAEPDCGIAKITAYRSVLSDLGGSPTRRSTVDAPDADQPDMFGANDDDDPDGEKYLSW